PPILQSFHHEHPSSDKKNNKNTRQSYNHFIMSILVQTNKIYKNTHQSYNHSIMSILVQTKKAKEQHAAQVCDAIATSNVPDDDSQKENTMTLHYL
ncbi:MAG: hypothetical protein ACR2IL_01815, partial [Chitinophagaceae bacterium]